MKKSKYVLIALVICISFLLVFSQAAFAADGVKLKASIATGITGDEVTIIITVEDAEDTEGGEFVLSFDEDLVKPVDFDEGKFVSDASGSMIMENLEFDDGKLMVMWVTPNGDTDESGEVCKITFELLDDGETFLTFSDVVIAPEDADVSATHTAGKITIVDPAVAKQNAIDAADEAIADLPDPEDITLDDKADVEAARALVEEAKTKHGAVNSDFEDYQKLLDAEAMIAKLEAIKVACDAVNALPSVSNLTLAHKPDVVAARALVTAAKTNHGAVDADFTCLNTLTAAENRIKELEGLQPTPPTGGTTLLLPLGLLVIIGGGLAIARRKRFAVK
ncbi:MAG: cohesin domain-containing protein [Bacillota bacterium]|nr:cohesin domain-containing protein [Bacillota bacterium]